MGLGNDSWLGYIVISFEGEDHIFIHFRAQTLHDRRCWMHSQ